MRFQRIFVAIFRERAAHLVYRLFSLLYIFVALVVCHLGFEGTILVLIAPDPFHCSLRFTIYEPEWFRLMYLFLQIYKTNINKSE